MKLPDTWLETRLGEVLSRVEAKVNPQTSAISSHFYVGLEHIESQTGRLLRGAEEVTEGVSILSIKTAYQQNDILYGKLRPNLNKVYLAEQEGICSTDIWALRASGEILPEFALHYLRSSVVHIRASQLATGANLPRIPANSFDRIPLPLPTLPEQQRIVDMLRQAESLGKYRSDTRETIDMATREFCVKLFGDVFTNNKSWPVAKLGKVSEIVRGSSPRPQGDSRLYGGPVPRLMVSDLTRDGLWVNATTDSLTEEGAKSSRAMPARSVVMAVSGTPGMTAILNHDACIHDGFVGLRDLDQNLLPEFLAYTLNLLRAKNDQQAVGAVFRNLTTDQVKAIPIPLPPFELQQQFQEFLFQVQAIQADITSSDKLLAELLNTIRIDAFSGELTESWRQCNLAKISESVLVRDARLSERGAKVSVHTEVFAPPERPTDFSRPMRQWLVDELSNFQHEVWNMLHYEWRGSVIVDDPESFDDFCTNPQTAWRIEHFKASNKRIRQTLEQLAALGLIAKVSVPKSNAVTQQTEYLTTYRPLREDENTRLLDAARLKSDLEKSESASSNNAGSNNGSLGEQVE